MLIDCDRCVIRDVACSDCMVTALLDKPGRRREIGEEEFRALAVLAEARLVSPLRLREAQRTTLREALPKAS